MHSPALVGGTPVVSSVEGAPSLAITFGLLPVPLPPADRRWWLLLPLLPCPLFTSCCCCCCCRLLLQMLELERRRDAELEVDLRLRDQELADRLAHVRRTGEAKTQAEQEERAKFQQARGRGNPALNRGNPSPTACPHPLHPLMTAWPDCRCLPLAFVVCLCLTCLPGLT